MKLKIIKGNEEKIEKEFNYFAKENKIIKTESHLIDCDSYVSFILMVYYWFRYLKI